MAELQLNFLGGVGISQNGTPIADLHVRKAQALLCYLAVNQQPFSREALAGLLWGEMPEANARMNLRRTLSRLRPFFGPHLHITTREVAFNRELPYWLDVEQFETAVTSKNNNQLREAIDLYRGDFLDGFHVKNASAFEEWTLAQRVWLRDLAVQTLHTLVANYLQQTAFSDGIAYANRLLALDPWREEAHRQLMELLARNGQRSAALMQYDACRRILSEELGVDPAPTTVALYEQILHGQFDEAVPLVLADSTEVTELIRTEPTIRHNLPPQATRFVGRESELTTLEGFLANPDVRRVTIVGAGGMGKTRLALACADWHLNMPDAAFRFPDGIFFVSLAALAEAEHITSTLAEALDYPIQSDGRSPQQQILDYLRHKRMLLIMGNFEHLLAGAGLLANILQAAPDVQILVTSRERIQLQEEQVLTVHGLSYPQGKAEEDVFKYAAVQLFLQTAQKVLHNFTVPTDKLVDLIRICQLVEGMPLGLELAASWVDILPLAKIADEIEKSLGFLETDTRNLPQRHRSMRAVFEYSWQQLSAEEKRIFPQLSVFRGGFTRQAAREVADASLRTLSRLVKKSFLQYDRDRDRYQIHELMRQFGAEKINALDDEKLRNRHLVYFTNLIEQQQPQLHRIGQIERMQQLDWEYANIQTALAWSATDTRRVESGLRMITSLDNFWVIRSHVHEGRKWLAKLRFLAGDKLSPKMKAKTLFRAGKFESFSGARDLACRLLEESLALCHQTEDEALMANVLSSLGQLERYRGNHDAALAYFQDSLKLNNDKVGTAFTMREMGRLAMVKRQWAVAHSYLAESLHLYQQAGDHISLAWGALLPLGILAMQEQNLALAKQHLLKAYEILQKTGYLRGLGAVLNLLGELARMENEYQKAVDYSNKSLEIAQDLGVIYTVAKNTLNLGLTYVQLGEEQQAEKALRKSLSSIREMGGKDDDIIIALCLDGLASLAAIRGRTKRAARLFGASETLLAKTNAMLAPPDQKEHDRNIGIARKQLSTAAFEAAWAEGDAMTMEQVLAYVLAE
ncbi:MAG: BTAD domain-containing putative transcriptional regulator [Anaerolineae bacterium]